MSTKRALDAFQAARAGAEQAARTVNTLHAHVAGVRLLVAQGAEELGTLGELPDQAALQVAGSAASLLDAAQRLHTATRTIEVIIESIGRI